MAGLRLFTYRFTSFSVPRFHPAPTLVIFAFLHQNYLWVWRVPNENRGFWLMNSEGLLLSEV